jgi:hypothetical protein
MYAMLYICSGSQTFGYELLKFNLKKNEKKLGKNLKNIKKLKNLKY